MTPDELEARVRAYAEERGYISHQSALYELAGAYLDLIDTIREGGTAIAVSALNSAAEVDEPWPPPEVMEHVRRA